MKKIILIVTVIAVFSSCKKEEIIEQGPQQQPPEQPKAIPEIKSIRHGTSFAMCVGYCNKDITYTSNKVVYQVSGKKRKPHTYNETLTADEWKLFRTQVNVETFFKLSKVIGCPDCNDGGAEWLEIETTTGQKHKVTFEFRKEPESLKDLLAELRQFEWEFEMKRKGFK